MTATQIPMLHLRYDGGSHDVPLTEVDLGDAATDAQIREAAATHLSVPLSKMAGYVVDRNTETGDITLRPQAVFGANCNGANCNG